MPPKPGATAPSACRLPDPGAGQALARWTSYAHTFVEGSVLTTFTVMRSGAVAQVRVVASHYRVKGRGDWDSRPHHFDGFLEPNVVVAMSQWRFAPREQPCAGLQRFNFVRGD